VTTTLDCDNQLGAAFDGCDDNCEVESGFVCSVDYVTTFSTVCSYNLTIQLSIVEFTRNGDSNNFLLKIQVLPPLNIFKISSQSEIAQLFDLVVTNFTVNGLVYNSADSILEFNMDLTADLTDRNINLTFSTGNSSRPEYFATPNVSLILQLDFGGLDRLFMISTEQKSIAILTLYLSWVIVVVGWLSCILGAFMHRLSGLEAMFVIQFSWISIFLLRGPLTYPFAQMWPLRFSAGVNYAFAGIDTVQSAHAPYSSQFKLNSVLFYSNFNICAAFQLLSLVAVIITYLRIRLFRTRNKLTGREIYLIDSLAQQNTRLIDQHEFSEQLLIYTSLLNLIYFVVCTAMFCKYG